MSLVIGNSFSKADYLEADMQVIDGKADTAHTYFEEKQNYTEYNPVLELGFY